MTIQETEIVTGNNSNNGTPSTEVRSRREDSDIRTNETTPINVGTTSEDEKQKDVVTGNQEESLNHIEVKYDEKVKESAISLYQISASSNEIPASEKGFPDINIFLSNDYKEIKIEVDRLKEAQIYEAIYYNGVEVGKVLTVKSVQWFVEFTKQVHECLTGEIKNYPDEFFIQIRTTDNNLFYIKFSDKCYQGNYKSIYFNVNAPHNDRLVLFELDSDGENLRYSDNMKKYQSLCHDITTILLLSLTATNHVLLFDNGLKLRTLNFTISYNDYIKSSSIDKIYHNGAIQVINNAVHCKDRTKILGDMTEPKSENIEVIDIKSDNGINKKYVVINMVEYIDNKKILHKYVIECIKTELKKYSQSTIQNLSLCLIDMNDITIHENGQCNYQNKVIEETTAIIIKELKEREKESKSLKNLVPIAGF